MLPGTSTVSLFDLIEILGYMVQLKDFSLQERSHFLYTLVIYRLSLIRWKIKLPRFLSNTQYYKNSILVGNVLWMKHQFINNSSTTFMFLVFLWGGHSWQRDRLIPSSVLGSCSWGTSGGQVVPETEPRPPTCKTKSNYVELSL